MKNNQQGCLKKGGSQREKAENQSGTDGVAWEREIMSRKQDFWGIQILRKSRTNVLLMRQKYFVGRERMLG